jgi:hypothetical protein
LKIRSYAYRSENRFAPEELDHGLGIKPTCSIPDAHELPKDVRSMMNEQRRTELSKPNGEARIYIGGEIIVHHLTVNGYNRCVGFRQSPSTLAAQDDRSRKERVD